MTTLRLAGVDVPRVGLGTNRLTPDHAEFVRQAVDAGCRHIDTAHLYTGGESEEAIGRALGADHDDLVVATKGGYREADPGTLHREIEQSLRALRTDTIRLYYLHRVSGDTEPEESLGAIAEHVDRGEIQHVGISSVEVEQIERARRVVPIAAVQNEYNLGERGHDDVVDHCAAEGIPFVPYFPLRGGDRDAVDEVARRHGVSPNTVKLAWLLRRSPTMLPIPGTLSIEHLRDNLAALELELSDEDVATLG
jgi:aryl-alcohol dehydrogenase-like predicted oxidoreductase